MKPQPLVRHQSAFARFGIVTIHLAQHLQYITAFIGEVIRHIHELAACVRAIQISG
jgi:hypothetical protein